MGARAVEFAASPTIAFCLQTENANRDRHIQSVALRAQILIEASRRTYSAIEGERLRDLFGEKDRWGHTLRPLLWTHASTTIPAFSDKNEMELTVPCTFDFNVGAAKYFYAIRNESVPLCFQFSGTVFYQTPAGGLQIDQIGWNQESRFQLPAAVWHEMMDHYYPDSAWLRIGRDAFDKLYQYKTRHGNSTWEEAIDALLLSEQEAVK